MSWRGIEFIMTVNEEEALQSVWPFAGLVLGIASFLLSLSPSFGVLAWLTSVPCALVAIVGRVQSRRAVLGPGQSGLDLWRLARNRRRAECGLLFSVISAWIAQRHVCRWRCDDCTGVCFEACLEACRIMPL